MAMKRKRFVVILSGGTILIALLSAHIFDRDRAYKQEAWYTAAHALKELPESEGSALREIAKLKASLAGLTPSGPYIVVDTHSERLFLRSRNKVILEATCSTGSGGTLTDTATGRQWVFDTPRGIFAVDCKLVEPWWRKPDWAYIEEEQGIPESESERMDPEMLGTHAIGFGNGYFIHGTIYERLLGVSVTHGCVRLGSDDLRKLYEKTRIGTPVYIF